ncbi:MAG: rhomboid family intramembrane serine protease [Mesorhizobium sp.]
MNEPTSPAKPDRTPASPERGPRRGREPMFNLPGVVLAIIGLCAAVYLLQFHVLDDSQNYVLLYDAAFIPVLYTGRYGFDWFMLTRPFTYTFLHGSFAHIAVNMVWLAAFGPPLANRFGAARFAFFFAMTGLAAAAFFFAIHPFMEAPLVGASGSISGMMGAAARFGFQMDRSAGRSAFSGQPLPFSMVLRSRSVVAFLAIWMIINLVTGLVGIGAGDSSQIAWEAHIGGFLVGFFGLRLFDRQR